jgi:N-methylhydantoinase B
MTTRNTSNSIDVVSFEIIRSSLASLVHEMGLYLERAAFSPSIVEGRDFTLALLDPSGAMIANGPEDQPAHLGTLEFTARAVMHRFPSERIAAGDVFLFNDPYTGGTHCQDVRVVRPIFVKDQLFAWLLAVGHWTDVGGQFPGTFNPVANSCFQEGIRIPPVKLVEAGTIRDDLVDLVLANCRLPAESHGDLIAMLSSCALGEERLNDLLAKYGVDNVAAVFEHSKEYCERLLLSQTSALPDGVYEAEDYIDMDPSDPQRRPVRIACRLTVEDGRLHFDFSDSDPQPKGSVGGTLPTTWSGVLCAVLNYFPGVPFNNGVLRVISVTTRPKSCVHIELPTPFSGMAAGALEKVISVVLRVLGEANPSQKTAAMYNLCNLTVSGRDPRFDDREWIMYLWLPGGFGGTAMWDAGLPTMMLYGPGCRNQPVEMHERLYPILYERVEMRQDSMGPGLHRGGPGIDCVFRMTAGSAELSAIGDRHRFPIWGVDGGGSGAAQDIIVSRGDGRSESLGMHAAGVLLDAGDRVVFLSGGGGGFGRASDRAPDAVRADVTQGLLSVERALSDYGVDLAG